MSISARMKSRGRSRQVSPRYGRLKALRARLRQADVDALLVTNPRDIRYLTGFIGDDSWAVVPARAGKTCIISDRRFEQQIAREAPQAAVVMREGKLAEALQGWVKNKRIDRVAIQPGYVTVAQRQALVKAIGAKRLVAVEDGLLQQRAVKERGEIEAIGQALWIQQEAFKQTLGFIKPGRSEREIAAYLEYRMRSLGADGASFPSIVAVDENAALPHAIPGEKKVTVGSMILIDWGAKAGGYCSDLTRVVAVGRMSREVAKIYRVVLAAQAAGIAAIRPGAKLKDVDGAARDVIEQAGYGQAFGHSLGHGIGLDIHEQPTLGRRAEGTLEAGQVVTVEPGIYLPGVGGVRIEDDVLVTRQGGRVLSDLPKAIESAIIASAT